MNGLKSNQLTINSIENLLIELSTTILSKETESEVAWSVTKNCISQLGFEDCVFYLTNLENNKLIQMAAYGPKNPKDYNIYQPIEISLGEGICGYVAESGVGEIIEDTTLDKRYIADDEIRHSEISIPIKIDNKVIGIIDCEHSEKGFFTEQHFKLLSTIASFCAIKIDSIRKSQETKRKEQALLQAQHDMVKLKGAALKVQMNPHFVFNALSAIQYFILSNDKRNALHYLSVFGKLVRHYLTHFEKDELELVEEFKMLDCYLELQQLRYEDRFEYDLKIVNRKEIESLKIPTMVLPTLIENAIENSVSDRVNRKKLSIRIELLEKELLTKVVYFAKEIKKQAVNYREQLTTLENQIELFNKVKNVHIGRQTNIQSTCSGTKVSLQLTIPVLE